MKKRLTIISMTLIVGGLLYFTNIKSSKAYYYGPLAGYTGSPHDGKTCDYSGCHNTHSLQSPQPWISSNVPSQGYSPDSTYTITAKASHLGSTSFGFEISPQSATGAELGKLINSSSSTQIVAAKYIEQTLYGYQGIDSLIWTFQWKAPVAGTGPVTFYGAFNCGNGNSSAANTYVYPATLTIPENTSAGIQSLADENTSFSIFPNPAKGQCNISYILKNTANVEIDMYGTDGRKITTLLNNTVNEGEHVQTTSFPEGIKTGMYFIRLIANGKSAVQIIVVE